ncbi:MAG: hypothetical protein ACT4OO_10740 [Nitrospiraceae bacterium]
MSQRILLTVGGSLCAVMLLAGGIALAENTWVDEITNSVAFYKTNYPTSNWDPYLGELNLVREALHRGDQRLVRSEMGKWFKMLRNREYGIHEVAADELFNFALMVTPVQEYGISVPSAAGGGF